MASRSWNRVELIGNLTRDPELRFTPNGAAVCTFGLATNRTFVTDGEKREEVDFHRLVSWNKLAELCNQLLKKGIKVFISGRLQTRSWEGQDGIQRQTTEIVIEDMIILTPRSGGEISRGEDLSMSELSKEKPKIAEIFKKEEPRKDDASVAEKKEKAAPDEAPSSAKGEALLQQEDVKDDLPF